MKIKQVKTLICFWLLQQRECPRSEMTVYQQVVSAYCLWEEQRQHYTCCGLQLELLCKKRKSWLVSVIGNVHLCVSFVSGVKVLISVNCSSKYREFGNLCLTLSACSGRREKVCVWTCHRQTTVSHESYGSPEKEQTVYFTHIIWGKVVGTLQQAMSQNTELWCWRVLKSRRLGIFHNSPVSW